MPSVLFVCTGNVCRSPMAEVLFIDHLKRSGLDPAQWQVGSAGTWTENGYPASSNSVEVMKERGLDLSQHNSRVVTADLLAQFDLISYLVFGRPSGLLGGGQASALAGLGSEAKSHFVHRFILS